MVLQLMSPERASQRVIVPRRRFLLGAAVVVAAPAIVRASSLMPIATDPYFGMPRWRVIANPIDRGR